MAFASSLDQIGPIAKNVADIALCMNVIAGEDDYDATVSKKRSSWLYKIFRKNDIKGMKIGVPKEYFIDGIKEDVRKIVNEALEKFRELGAEIIEISLPHTKYAVPTYYVLAPAEASSNLARFDGVRYGYRSKDIKNIDDLYINSRTEGLEMKLKEE